MKELLNICKLLLVAVKNEEIKIFPEKETTPDYVQMISDQIAKYEHHMKKHLVVISNNGNHTGKNRIWTLLGTFDTIEDANEKVNEVEEENGDAKDGLTICKVIEKIEIEEMKEEGNVLINF